MSGIYLHIPFCKQACHYCNFHFSTSKKNKDVVIESMIKELEAKSKDNFDIIETIYFGGGTPSILSISEINKFIKIIYKNFKISENIEITLEANPEDLSLDKVKELSLSSVNRLSIGIQSFNDTELKMMNRSHNSNQSKNCIENALRYFDNLSIDLIYGMPNSNLKSWAKNLQMLESWEINHISAYALTVESNTALKKFIEKEIIVPLDEQEVYDQYNFMFEKLSLSNYINYELSSFAKEGYFSKNNSSYWLGKKYIGIGPSAHSFDGKIRSWNISNNSQYVKHIGNNRLFYQNEHLSKIDQYNEYVMTGLRTIWGVSLDQLEKKFGKKYSNHLLAKSKKFIDLKMLEISDNIVFSTRKGKFLSDGIASELFIVNR